MAGPATTSLVAHQEGDCIERFRQLDLPVVIVNAPPPLDQFGGALLRLSAAKRISIAGSVLLPYAYRLACVLRGLGISLVHTADFVRGVPLAGPAAAFLGLPLVAHVRGEYGGIPAFYVHGSAALSRKMILVSPNIWPVIPDAYKHRCEEIADPVVEPPAIPAPVRSHLLQALSEPLSIGKTDFLIVSVGTLVPQKGAHRLIEALKLAGDILSNANNRPRIGALFIGKCHDEQYRRFLVQRARALGLQDVRFLGWLSDEQVDAFYRTADMACFPGVQYEVLHIDGVTRIVACTDALPRGVTEPMTYGLPVVATTVAGIEKAIVDGRNGLLVPPSNSAALATAIVRLVTDPSLRERLGQAGRDTIMRTCSMKEHVHRISAIYDVLMASEPRRRNGA